MTHGPTAQHHGARWYDANAERFFGQTVDLDTSQARSRFLALTPQGGRILDAGCGSGRDSLHFLRAGMAVDAFDASESMVRLAREHTGLPVARMDFADLAARGEIRDEYDGVWAMASLIHLDRDELPGALRLLALRLRPGGALLASFRKGPGRSLPCLPMDEAGLADILSRQDLLAARETWTRPDDRPDRPDWLYALMTRTLPSREVHP